MALVAFPRIVAVSLSDTNASMPTVNGTVMPEGSRRIRWGVPGRRSNAWTRLRSNVAPHTTEPSVGERDSTIRLPVPKEVALIEIGTVTPQPRSPALHRSAARSQIGCALLTHPPRAFMQKSTVQTFPSSQLLRPPPTH